MKLARTNWIGVGVMLGAGASTIGQWMPWYNCWHWGYGIALLGAATVIALLFRRAERGSDMYRILRQGKPSIVERCIFRSDSRHKAWEKFQAVRDRVRQGTVRLKAPDGEVIAFYSAPMARTRW